MQVLSTLFALIEYVPIPWQAQQWYIDVVGGFFLLHLYLHCSENSIKSYLHAIENLL